MDEQQIDGVEGEGDAATMSIADTIKIVEKKEADAGGDFTQKEYFDALRALKGARVTTQVPEERAKVDAKLEDLFDRYGRLGSY